MMSQQSEHLLTYLKNSPLLEGYSLSVYPSRSAAAPAKARRHLCGTRGVPHLCHKICSSSLNLAADDALASGKPQFFRCPLGLLTFALPLSADSCLLGGGKRENLFDLYFYSSEQFESLKERENIDPFELLEQLEKLPVSTEEEMRETALKVERLIASFPEGKKAPRSDPAHDLQGTVRDIAAAIGGAEEFGAALALFSEALGVLFDVPAIALVQKDEESDCWLVETCWGTLSGPSCVAAEKLPFRGDMRAPAILDGEGARALFPGTDAAGAVCLPLSAGQEFLGMAVLFDASVAGHNLSLAGLLADRLAEKLQENLLNPETRRQQRVVRLLEMIRTLVLTESQDDLLRLIMEMSAELVGAASGSLMIIDRKRNILRVASALGIHPLLARSLSCRMGEGIAGSVAASGAPLLIKDIEQEPRVGRRSRSRYATRSCVSLPLRLRGKTIGVLNLADKKNNAPFAPADQDILSTFTEQAAIILERATTLKKARLNAVTDPLTTLYTVRFIKQRLNEELSRSLRHNLKLTLMFVSLDNFAAFQDARGRAQANRAVKRMAQVLTASLRDIDLVGRSGAAEFCVILPVTRMKEAGVVAQRIERNIRRELFGGNAPALPESVAMSIGIASFPENGGSSDDLIAAARTALSQAEALAEGKIFFAVS